MTQSNKNSFSRYRKFDLWWCVSLVNNCHDHFFQVLHCNAILDTSLFQKSTMDIVFHMRKKTRHYRCAQCERKLVFIVAHSAKENSSLSLCTVRKKTRIYRCAQCERKLVIVVVHSARCDRKLVIIVVHSAHCRLSSPYAFTHVRNENWEHSR